MTFANQGLATAELPVVASDILVSEERFTTSDGLVIAMNRYEPVGVDTTAVLWCLPCGGCSRNYFDFTVKGSAPESYSFARYLARRGISVITADHIGVGDSTHLPEQPEITTAVFCSDRMHEAVQAFRLHPDFARKTFIGVGHSFGSGMVLTEQYRYQDFDALVLLGWSSIQLAMVYKDGTIKAISDPGDRARMSVTNLGYNVPDELFEANKSIATTRVLPAGDEVNQPDWCVPASRSVRVPTYLGFGEFDTLLDPYAEAELYVDAPKVVTAILPGSYHFHNLAEGRELMWSGITTFVRDTVGNQ
ncbi:MAG: alpha/beta fold hydrolase [Actinomycetes bacterium]